MTKKRVPRHELSQGRLSAFTESVPGFSISSSFFSINELAERGRTGPKSKSFYFGKQAKNPIIKDGFKFEKDSGVILRRKRQLLGLIVLFACVLTSVAGCQRSWREVPEASKIPAVRESENEKEPDQPYDNI